MPLRRVSVIQARARKADILSLLEGLAHGSWYANKDQRFLRMSRSRHDGHSGYEWFSWGEFLGTGNEYHDPQWVRQAHRLVGKGIKSYLALLHSPEKDVVQATLDLLAGFQEYNTQLIPVIAPLAFEEAEVSLQIAALRCLGALLEPQSAYWERYQQLTQASEALSEIKFAAAYTLAWYHPSSASQAVVNTLLASVLPPQSCYRLREVCKALSHLGAPHGFQGLMDALKYGADHWSILDTIRVAEALLDVAFFGGWVQNRYWHRTIGKPLSAVAVLLNGAADQATDEELTDQEDNTDEDACFKWDYSTGLFWRRSLCGGRHKAEPARKHEAELRKNTDNFVRKIAVYLSALCYNGGGINVNQCKGSCEGFDLTLL